MPFTQCPQCRERIELPVDQLSNRAQCPACGVGFFPMSGELAPPARERRRKPGSLTSNDWAEIASEPAPKSPPPLAPAAAPVQPPAKPVATAGTILTFAFLGWLAWTLYSNSVGNKVASRAYIGMPESRVLSEFGSPHEKQVLHSQFSHTEFWYYGRAQLGIENGRVTSINKY